MIKLIGIVSFDQDRPGNYVRVSIRGRDGIPLSIKATFGNFARSAFTRGRIVEVFQNDPGDQRRFTITRVFSPVDEAEAEKEANSMDIKHGTVLVGEVGHVSRISIPGGPVRRLRVAVSLGCSDPTPMYVKTYWNQHARGPVPQRGDTIRVRFHMSRKTGAAQWVIDGEQNETKDAEAFGKEQAMTHSNTMSHDRVRFFISDSYYKNVHQQGVLRDVLKKAFGLGTASSTQCMSGCCGGFYVVCRPSQFARFLIFRNDAGIKNGFVDLQAKLYVPAPPKDGYTLLAEKIGITRDQAKRAALALHFSDCHEVEERVGNETCDNSVEIDVSRNKHEPC